MICFLAVLALALLLSGRVLAGFPSPGSLAIIEISGTEYRWRRWCSVSIFYNNTRLVGSNCYVDVLLGEP